MPIHSGDVKLLKSAVMADVPEGGGAPTGNAIADGVSNAIFPDISELDRAGGRVNLRKTFVQVATDDTDLYFGSNLIVAEPPKDPLVAVTFFSSAATFETRQQATSRVEQYLNRGPLLSGYLLENHVAGQRTLQLLQRPGEPPPNIGRTIVLVLNEETAQEQLQYVRVIASEVKTQTFTEIVNGQLTDFQADVVTLEISDALRNNWPGSPATRLFTPANGKTRVRDTVVADAGSYYGVAPLVAPVAIGDVTLKAASVYSQLVPNARTETAALDQRPAAQRLLQLASTPRRVEVSNTPHTMRMRVGQENRGYSWVQILKPFPAPGTVIVSYMALGQWYTLQDDGAGGFTGQGVGTVNYTNGSISITLPALPDVNTSILLSWGEKSAYTNRSGQAGYRAPEFSWELPQAPLKPGSVVVKWMSGNALKTATDNGNGGFTGDASGEINYPAGKIFLRPSAMIDAGGEFSTDYEYSSSRTENFNSLTPDAGGFGSLTLSETPAPNSVTVRWMTTRTVSASSGSSEIVSTTGSGTNAPPLTVVVAPVTGTGNYVNASAEYILSGEAIDFSLRVHKPQTPGTYTWEIAGLPDGFNGALIVQGGTTTGTFTVTGIDYDEQGYGDFKLPIASDCPDVSFHIDIKNQALTTIARSNTITVDTVAVQPPAAFPPVLPPPAIVVPTETVPQAVPMMAYGGVTEDGTRVYVKANPRTTTALGATYDPPEVNSLAPIVWTAGDLAAKEKLITSQSGVPVTYSLWG